MVKHYTYEYKALNLPKHVYWAHRIFFVGPLKDPFVYIMNEEYDYIGIYVYSSTTLLTYDEFIEYAKLKESEFFANAKKVKNGSYLEYCKVSDEGCGKDLSHYSKSF